VTKQPCSERRLTRSRRGGLAAGMADATGPCARGGTLTVYPEVTAQPTDGDALDW
jgi:hypothetical protein